MCISIGRRASWMGALGLAAVVLCPLTAQAAPSTKIGTAPFLTPAAADAFYSASTTTPGSTLPEVAQLAAALKGDPDLIYEYVRNNTDTVWTYGLSKGALGVIIDRAGTSFDQAQAMVELVRASGGHAEYKIGAITLTGAQFATWTGIESATAACQLLSSGGIPGVINGSTLSDCSYGSASVSSIEIGHAWAAVRIDGVDYHFDPSFKAREFKPGFNLDAMLGLSTPGAAMAAATNGMQSGTVTANLTAGATTLPFVRALQSASLRANLQSYAATVQSAIETQAASGRLEDVVGGGVINRTATPEGGLRQATLPYPSLVQRTYASGLPDVFRTKLSVIIGKFHPGGPSQQIVDVDLFADQIYGRRLVFYDANYNGVWDLEAQTTFIGKLELIDERNQITVLNQPTPISRVDPRDSYGAVTLTADLPYAAHGGSYMDVTFTRPKITYALPLTIVHAWGNTGPGLIERFGARPDDPIFGPDGWACPQETCHSTYLSSKGGPRREQIAAAWMAQASRSANIHAALADSVYAQHYSVGLVYAESLMQGTQVTSGSGTNSFAISDSYDRVDVQTGFSLTSRTADADRRRAAVHATAGTLALLEGSVAGQIADLPDVGSTATRFAWGNSPPATEDLAPTPGAARRFYRVPASLIEADAGELSELFVAEGQSSSNAPSLHGAGEVSLSGSDVSGWKARLAQAVAAYTSNGGYELIVSEESFSGPGQRLGSFRNENGGFRHRDGKQRGGAFVATKYVGGEPVEIAHVTVGPEGAAKGGGSGAQTFNETQYDPAKAADVLKARFVDRSSALGVDLRTGAVTYVSPAQLTVGSGEFPYKLDAQLIWRGGAEQDDVFGLIDPVAPPTPWTTNWHNSLSISGSGMEAMGATDVRAMAGTLAAFAAQQNIYRTSPTAEREVAAAIALDWWSDQLLGNVATVNVGVETRQFVRKYDDTWFLPGPGAFAQLQQSAPRVALARNAACSPGPYVLTRGWVADGLTFTLTNAHGDVQTFEHWDADLSDPSGTGCAYRQGFRLTNWTWPQGVNVTLTYSQPAQNPQYELPKLTSVRNSLGQEIEFLDGGLAGFKNVFAGNDARSVTATSSFNQASHTDPAGNVTSFQTEVVSAKHVLRRVFAADHTTNAALAYDYDVLGRVSAARDRLGEMGQRAGYSYLLAGGLRAERVDPLGASYFADFDVDGRPLRYVDEIGRETLLRHDGRGRITGYTYPEGDREELAYDDRNNPTAITKHAKPGSAEAGQAITIQASWNAEWNKLAWIRDAKGQQTDFQYGVSGGETGQLVAALRPFVTGGRPTYSFGYNAVGQLASSTDPTGVTSVSVYDPSGFLTSTTLDPGESPHVNAVTVFTNNVHGDPVAVDGPLTGTAQDIATITYDLLRRKVVETAPGLTNQKRTATKTHYDAVGRVLATEKGYYLGAAFTPLERSETIYDAVGNKSAQILLDGTGPTRLKLTAFSYDPLNRQICSAVRMDLTTPLSADPCVVYALTPSGPDRIKKNVYDAAGQLLIAQEAVGTDLKRDYATYAYTPNGQKSTITDANDNLTRYIFDGFDRLSRTEYPVVQRGAKASNPADYEAYTYDLNGNRQTFRRRNGHTITYSYDALDRVTFKDIPAAATFENIRDVTYTYDLAGRIKSASYDATKKIAYWYDTAGRLKRQDSYGRTVLSSYNKAGMRTRLTWPDGFIVRWAYDGAGRLTKVYEDGAVSGPGVLATFLHDDLGRRSEMVSGNGMRTLYAYDGASRLREQSFLLPTDQLHHRLNLSYGASGQIEQLYQASDAYVWRGHPAEPVNFAHDGLNRNASVAAMTGQDDNGPFGYDAAGNFRGAAKYVYDLENRLVGEYEGEDIGLVYDPVGKLRASQTGGELWTFFVLDGDRVIGEYGTKGTESSSAAAEPPVHRYVFGQGVDEPLVWYRGGTTADRLWLSANWQGSVIATANGAANEIQPQRYGPYGERTSWSGSRFAYTGQAQFPEGQFYHYRARAYNPSLGHFLQTDPSGQKDNNNLYAYAGGDPINFSDPTGNAAVPIKRGNDIKLIAYIRYVGPGASASVQNRFNSAIERVWTFRDGDVTPVSHPAITRVLG